MNEDIRRFLRLLREATSRVDNPYYELPIAGQDLPVYRERVYAYELYHQLRSIWPPPDQWGFVANGEVDKRGHPLFRDDSIANKIPDLLVHRPGDMAGNLVIVEIKSVDASIEEVAKDLGKLTAFCHLAGYQMGVLLFFGSRVSYDRLRVRSRDAMCRRDVGIDPACLMLCWQSGPLRAVEPVLWGDELNNVTHTAS